MNEKEYFRKLSDIPGSRKNQIIDAVNRKVAKDKAGLKDEVEKMFFDRLMLEAAAHEDKHGFWPTFEMCEIESDDPKLDIYNDEV